MTGQQRLGMAPTRAQGPWKRCGRGLLAASLATAVVLALGAQASSAAILNTSVLRQPDAQGHTVVRVCVTPTSNFEQKKPHFEGLVHDTNPSLTVMIGQIRDALRRDWEEHTNLRFTGWFRCLVNSTGTGYVTDTQDIVLDIRQGNPNFSRGGATGLGSDVNEIFMDPWGNDPSEAYCIAYNGSQLRYEYYPECAREYAVHEFGHAVGLNHEWLSPDAPAACVEALSAAEVDKRTKLGPAFHDYATALSKKANYVPNTEFDPDSMMTYSQGDADHSDCAHVDGPRFGSRDPDSHDLQAVEAGYPPAPSSEDVPVGVIPDQKTACPELSRVTIYMDDEDANNNDDHAGWNGAIDSGSNTQLAFCRVEGKDLRPLKAPTIGRADYAVLKLGTSCPSGATEVVRTHDNEDDHNLLDDREISFLKDPKTEPQEDAFETQEGFNTNWMAGDVGPTRQNFQAQPDHDPGTQTELHWCFFPQSDSSAGTMAQFPDLGFEYGVLSASSNPFVGATGYIRTDDEDPDDDEAGQNTPNNDELSPSSESDAFSTVAPELDDNTTYLLGKVQRDVTRPIIVLNSRPRANLFGWYGGDVTITWSCVDPRSGTGTSIDVPPVTLSNDGADQTATGTCTDDAGNTSTDTQVNIDIDKTSPTITADRPAANAHGWYKGDVTITWHCHDDLSGFVPFTTVHDVTADQALTTEGANQSVSQSCTDLAFNSTGEDTQYASIDKTPPVMALVDAPRPNTNGWFNGDVPVTLSCSDALSGAEGSSAEFPVTFSNSTVTGEGKDLDVPGTCIDNAGNSVSEIPSSIDIDTIPPSIRLASRPSANSNGWYHDAVTIKWSCTDQDGLSGVVADSVEASVTTDGANQTAEGTCEDKADNTASNTQRGISIDSQPPTITLLSRPAANANGWYDRDVTIKWSCRDQDGLSGVVADTVEQTVSTDGASQSATGTCADKAGNTVSATEDGINIDTAAPTITLLSRPAANANGWYNGDVTIKWACGDQDGLSGVVSNIVQSTLSTEGADQTASGTCADRAGNTVSAAEHGINIDRTRPSIAIASPADGATFDLEQVVGAAYNCGDEPGGSGLASCAGDVASGGNLDTAHAGVHTFNVSARDKADNESTKTVYYTVRKAPTTLHPAGLLVTLQPGSLFVTIGQVSARLTYGPSGKPAAGRAVVVSTGSTPLCTATTTADGTATCTFGLSGTIRSALSLGYTVSFAGDSDLLPSTARGPALKILGLNLFA